jgi:hypothetical protein
MYPRMKTTSSCVLNSTAILDAIRSHDSAILFEFHVKSLLVLRAQTVRRHTRVMRPLRYSINITLDGCCDHRAIIPDEDLFRHGVENLAQADALLFGQ